MRHLLPSSRTRLLSAGALVGTLAALVTAACSSDLDATEGDTSGPSTKDGGTVASGGLPCDVAEVLSARCGSCHGESPQFGAPQSLVTYADLHAKTRGKAEYEWVGERIHDARAPMPPAPNARLTDAEAKVLDDWIADGAPKSSKRCAVTPSGEGEDDAGTTSPVRPSPLGCEADLQLRSKTKFTMPKNIVDEYVCVGIDVDNTTKRHVTAFAAHIDNSKILHHILLFQAPSSVSATPTACAAFGSVSWQLIAGWAPGADNFKLPEEAGFPEEKGTTHWVVQLHYNNAQGLEGQTDQSGFDLCTTDKLRPNDAGLMGFGGTEFSIPPRSKKTISCDYTIPPVIQSATLLRSWPHMHLLGTGLKSERIAGGKTETIVDDPTFNFQSQLSHPIAMKIAANDVIRTYCTWNNTTDRTVGFGENTGDEMCFNFITYYPSLASIKLPGGASPFSWIGPAQSAKCK